LIAVRNPQLWLFSPTKKILLYRFICSILKNATPPESAAVMPRHQNKIPSDLLKFLPSSAFAAIEQHSNAIIAAVPMHCCDTLWTTLPSLLQLKPADCCFPFSSPSGYSPLKMAATMPSMRHNTVMDAAESNFLCAAVCHDVVVFRQHWCCG